MMPPLHAHLDCDPGQDDAIAILYALGSSIVEIDSISVVGGNADVTKCARNALQILELAGRSDIPVYLGAAAPLKRLLQTLPEVFGESGMAGAENLPEPKRSIEEQTAVEKILSLPQGSTIVATGPLTNLALAVQKDPDFSGRIEKLVIMGGCVYPEHIRGWMGNYMAPNTTGYAEYNFAVDPEAAKIVLSGGFKNITLIGVNITRTVLYGHALDEKLRNAGSKCAAVAADILSTVGAEDHVDYASEKKSPNDPVRGIHDVVAMGAAARPDLFQFEKIPLTVTLDNVGDKALGQTLIDIDNPDHPSVNVVINLNREEFLNSMVVYVGNLT